MALALDDLRHRLLAVPDPVLAADPEIEHAITQSVRYLESDDAGRSIAADMYWPKWDSPWWHMLLLHELGEARRIPARATVAMTRALQAFPVQIFPIQPDDVPPTADPYRDVTCHCALGCMAQILAACGQDVHAELPWIRPWFVRYQMADGGLSCDETAYRVDECPSSMVATIAPFEAMTLGDPAGWTPDQAAFAERAAGFLIARQLMLGSQTRHNADEQVSATRWTAPCFPRFYFYDVVRGLAALVRWADITARPLPLAAVGGVIDHLIAGFPDGAIRVQRRAHDGVRTWMCEASGTWRRRDAALRFALLEVTSVIGQPSPPLTRQWAGARRGLVQLIDRGLLVD